MNSLKSYLKTVLRNSNKVKMILVIYLIAAEVREIYTLLNPITLLEFPLCSKWTYWTGMFHVRGKSKYSCLISPLYGACKNLLSGPKFRRYCLSISKSILFLSKYSRHVNIAYHLNDFIYQWNKMKSQIDKIPGLQINCLKKLVLLSYVAHSDKAAFDVTLLL